MPSNAFLRRAHTAVSSGRESIYPSFYSTLDRRPRVPSHPHDTLGERHRPVLIFLVRLAQGGDILVDAECDRKRTISENPKQCIMRLGESREQMHRLSQCRLTHEKHRVQLLNPITLNISAVASDEPECPARTELHPLIVVVLPTLSRRKRSGR